jgi:hypothetical protein
VAKVPNTDSAKPALGHYFLLGARIRSFEITLAPAFAFLAHIHRKAPIFPSACKKANWNQK